MKLNCFISKDNQSGLYLSEIPELEAMTQGETVAEALLAMEDYILNDMHHVLKDENIRAVDLGLNSSHNNGDGTFVINIGNTKLASAYLLEKNREKSK